MDNLRKFDTYADYSAATLNYPAVSWIVSGNTVAFDAEAPAVNGNLKLVFNISDTTNETLIYNTGGGSEGSEGSDGSDGSGGSGGSFTPDAMWIDGVEITPINTYRFTTTGEHVVELEVPIGELAQVEIPDLVFSNVNMVEVEIRNGVQVIGAQVFYQCQLLTAATIASSVWEIKDQAFDACYDLESATIYATDPPSIGYTIFDNNSPNFTIYVPAEAVEDYKDAWIDYSSIIQAI